MDENEKSFLQYVQYSRQIVNCMIKRIQKNDYKSLEIFGKLLTDYHLLLRDFEKISCPEIEEIIKLGMEAGASGGKIVGSGGSAVLLCRQHSIEAVKESIGTVAEFVYNCCGSEVNNS